MAGREAVRSAVCRLFTRHSLLMCTRHLFCSCSQMLKDPKNICLLEPYSVLSSLLFLALQYSPERCLSCCVVGTEAIRPRAGAAAAAASGEIRVPNERGAEKQKSCTAIRTEIGTGSPLNRDITQGMLSEAARENVTGMIVGSAAAREIGGRSGDAAGAGTEGDESWRVPLSPLAPKSC
jgi:hypothetical protein